MRGRLSAASHLQIKVRKQRMVDAENQWGPLVEFGHGLELGFHALWA